MHDLTQALVLGFLAQQGSRNGVEDYQERGEVPRGGQAGDQRAREDCQQGPGGPTVSIQKSQKKKEKQLFPGDLLLHSLYISAGGALCINIYMEILSFFIGH